MSKTLIKEAEQKILNHARFVTDMMTILDSMSYRLSGLSSDTGSWSDINEGLSLVRQGLFKELMYTISNCFAIQGVGGEEAAAFSKEYAKKVFGGNYAVMHLLNDHLRMPSGWLSDTSDAFKKELKEALEE